MISTKKTYSIIIPVFNSESHIEQLINQISNMMIDIDNNYEIILINDASKDNSWGKIKSLKKSFTEIQGINLKHNAGQNLALLCGLKHAQGEYIITLDDDLQNPVNEIPKLINKIKNNHQLECVFGIAINKKHSLIRNLGSHFFTLTLKILFPKNKKIKRSNFRIFTKNLKNIIIKNMHYGVLLSSLIFKYTSNIDNIYVEHKKRQHTKSNYTLLKLINITLDNIIMVSNIPEKIFFYTTFILLCIIKFLTIKKMFLLFPITIFLFIALKHLWLTLKNRKSYYLIDSKI